MKIYSSAFKDNGTVPIRHTGFGEDISPGITVCDAPENTISFALLLDDMDVPFCKSFNHWIVWNIPKTNTIPEGLPGGEMISEPIPACQGRAWGKNRYRGPRQPFFVRGEHRYVFTLYALDCRLDIPCSSDKNILLKEMSGHILATASVTGRFKRGAKNRRIAHTV